MNEWGGCWWKPSRSWSTRANVPHHFPGTFTHMQNRELGGTWPSKGKAQRSRENTSRIETKAPSLRQGNPPNTTKLSVVLVSLPPSAPKVCLGDAFTSSRSLGRRATSSRRRGWESPRSPAETARGRRLEPRGGAMGAGGRCGGRVSVVGGAPGGGGRCRATESAEPAARKAIRVRAGRRTPNPGPHRVLCTRPSPAHCALVPPTSARTWRAGRGGRRTEPLRWQGR